MTRGLWLAVWLSFGAAAAGCTTAAPGDASHPAAGRMPDHAQWRGVYQGPYHIALNIWTQGNRASGTWRAVGDREGEFSGTIFGDLLVIDWSEHGVGNSERYSGRGYFVYRVGKPGEPHHIYGEWGMGKTGQSSPWWAVKRADSPLRSQAQRLIDKDADDQYLDEVGCELGNCDQQDTESQ